MNLINIVSFLFFPKVCGICEKINKEGICKKCELKIIKLMKKNIDIKDEKIMFFKKHYFIFEYKGIIREKLIQYKFNNKSYYSDFFNSVLKKYINKNRILEKYDIIIPVPISKIKEKIRGYNQVTLMLKNIEKVDDRILIKTKENKTQSELTKQERKENVKNVYNVINEQKIMNKKILLIDDIYTTGETVKECCRMLSQYTKEIDVLTIAKDYMEVINKWKI